MEKLKKISNSTYEIEIVLNKDEVAKYLDEAINKDIKNIKEDGFRPGKMPKKMFLNKYGIKAVYPTAVDLIINDIYPKIITENKLNVVAQPNFDFVNLIISEEKFSVKGTVDVYPEFKLPDYKALKENIKKEEIKISKKEIKDEINNALEKDAKYEVIDDYEAKLGDIVVIDFEGFVDGVAFEGGKGENHSLTLGSNSFIPGFEEQLIGVKAGENKDVEVTFPAEYQAENLKGKDAIFKCLVHEVKKRSLPRLTEEKIKEFKDYSATTKEELENQIELKLKNQKEVTVSAEYEKNILKALVEEIGLELPKSLIDSETEHTLKNLENNFKNQGMTLDMYFQMTGMNLESLKKQMNQESKERLELQLILEKYLENEKIEISKQEIDEYLEKLAKSYNMDKEKILEQLGGKEEPIVRDLQYNKAREILFK